MTPGWKRMLAGGVFALGVLGAACSNYGGANNVDGGGTTKAATPPATTAAPSPAATTGPTTTGTSGGGVTCPKSAGTTAVVQQSFAFHPAKFSAKSCATVNLTNKDSITHTFTIDGSTVNVTLPGGSKNSAELALPPGTYTFYCRFHGSPDGSGMAGTLTVA